MSEMVPEGWVIRDFEQLSSNRKTKFQPQTESNKIVYLGLEHLGVASRKIKEFGNSVDIISTKTKFFKGDTLFGKLRPYLRKVAYPDCDGICSTDILALSPLKNTDPVFLFYICSSDDFIANAVESSAGNVMPRASWGDLAGFPVLSPPLPEQKKIASILTSVDEVIETTQKQIDKLQDLKKATMNELLTKGIGHTEFKDSELGRIPKSWEVKSIDDLCDRIIDYRGKSPPKSKSGIPLITAKNIRMGFIDKEPREYVGVDSFDGWMVRGIPKNGDIFFTTEAPLGYIALVPEYKHAVGQRVITISPNRNIYFPEFLSYFLQGRTFQKQIIDASTGSTVTGVKQSTLRKALTLTPPMKEQKDVSQIIKSIEVRINQVTAKLAQTQSLKKSLMQDLLTGKVRVQVN